MRTLPRLFIRMERLLTLFKPPHSHQAQETGAQEEEGRGQGDGRGSNIQFNYHVIVVSHPLIAGIDQVLEAGIENIWVVCITEDGKMLVGRVANRVER